MYLALLGDAIQGYQQNQLADQEDNILSGSLAKQKASQAQIDQAVNGLLGGMSKDTPAKAEADAMGDYRSALDSALPTGSGVDANTGGDYGKASIGELLGRKAQAFNLAGQLAKVSAPQTMRRQEGYDLDTTGQTVNKYRNFAGGDAGVTNVALQGDRKSVV